MKKIPTIPTIRKMTLTLPMQRGTIKAVRNTSVLRTCKEVDVTHTIVILGRDYCFAGLRRCVVWHITLQIKVLSPTQLLSKDKDRAEQARDRQELEVGQEVVFALLQVSGAFLFL
jgi:hypothetical protein